jgi:hypothetical protein
MGNGITLKMYLVENEIKKKKFFFDRILNFYFFVVT